MLCLLLLSGLLLNRVSYSQIQSNRYTSGNYGDDATLKCELNNAKGVQQVIWQLTKSAQTVASYSTKYGKDVEPAYRDKVVFTGPSLTAPSITVRNLTWSDECCYNCWFNTFPDGSMKGQTCLSVQGISEVTTASGVADHDSRTVVVSCSATGRPTPVIQWKVSPDITPVPTQNETQGNADSTWTSTSNITLVLPPDWDGQVECQVNPGTGAQTRIIRLPKWETRGRQDLGQEKDHEGEPRIRVGVIVLATILLSAAAAAAFAIIRWRTLKSKTERKKTEERPMDLY